MTGLLLIIIGGIVFLRATQQPERWNVYANDRYQFIIKKRQ